MAAQQTALPAALHTVLYEQWVLRTAPCCPLQADKKLLAPKRGFLGGMGERGVGGSKCGATAAVALLYKDAQGRKQLLAANAGDARVVLARNGKAVQLTTDHVPDM